MKLLCITDPTTHPEFDTTVELYNRLAEREDFSLFHTPADGINPSGRLRVCEVAAPIPYDKFLQLDQAARETAAIGDFDLVFSRADKPFPPDYLENLALFEKQVEFVNRPSGIIKVSQKDFFYRRVQGFTADWILTRDYDEVKQFFEKHGEIVAKKSFSYGGRGVFRIRREGSSFGSDNINEGQKSYDSLEELVSYLFSLSEEPFEFVEFLTNSSAGDKRVLVVGGEILGAYLRKAASGSWVHNITSGGTHHRAELEEWEQHVVQKTWPEYEREGVNTLGYDFLQGDDGRWMLSEINAGNIGGYGRLEELSGKEVYAGLFEWLIRHASAGGL